MRKESVIKIIDGQLNLITRDILKLDEQLALFAKEKCSEDVVFKTIKQLIKKYPANSVIISRLLEFLQLANDPKIIDTYDLGDLELLYLKLSVVYKDDIDVNTECYHFIYNIADKEKQALREFNNFKKRIEKKLSLTKGSL